MQRSLKVPVGFSPSFLMDICRMPNARAIPGAGTRGVKPSPIVTFSHSRPMGKKGS